MAQNQSHTNPKRHAILTRDPELQKRAEQLKAEGYSYAQISAILEVSLSSARRLADPLAREERRRARFIDGDTARAKLKRSEYKYNSPLMIFGAAQKLLRHGWEVEDVAYFLRMTPEELELLISEGLV
jgi:transposase